MSFHLPTVIKALLFSSSDALSVKEIQKVFTRFHEEKEKEQERREKEKAEGSEPIEEAAEEAADPWPEDVPSLITSTNIREAVENLRESLREEESVYDIQKTHDGYRMVIRPEHSLWVKLLRNEPREIKLSQAALETLAVIAYRQPATKAEIEAIRGVSVDGAVQRLLERDLILIKGRADLPGRPIQYGTTDRFLEFIGLQSLEELPSSDVLSPRQVDEWIVRASKQSDMSDKDMGLPEENASQA
ncbi:MAG: SMC-Scp complex subunit ScpB [Opitutales bacterium]|nr:SMC-Scp complex subunit ScpB [Opitutales bacterium]